MADKSSQLSTLATNIKEGIDARIKDLHTSCPGIIVSFDPVTQLASVQPAVKRVFKAREGNIDILTPSALPILINVLVQFPRGGGFSLTFPVKKGDECLLVFCERSIDNWHKFGGIKDPLARRFHHLSDATAFVGLSSLVNKVPSYDPINTQIKKDDGSVLISLNNDTTLDIHADGDINVDSGANVNVDAIADVVVNCANADVTATGACDITAPTINLNGNVNISGLCAMGANATVTGSITNNGTTIGDDHIHTQGNDSNGDTHAGAPPGNLRIAEAAPSPPPDHFKLGFVRRDIIEQRERFLDYAEERGAYVAGASSVQGEAPKYLLVEDHAGLFHAEGALPDEKARKFWLVKFPRGRRTDKRNQQVLRNEAAYLEVARRFGIRTGEPLVYEEGALFVPRFDRNVSDGRVERLGMNSLYAVANIPGFGAVVHHDTYCRALAQVASDPEQELREYMLRDILNLALRNTDNHGRNAAVLRTGAQVGLSPLFDFAPMFLDPEGIGRVSRWDDERPGSQPEWAIICEKFKDLMHPGETRSWLADLSKEVTRLPDAMQRQHVDDDIIQRLTGWIDEVAAGLAEARPRTWR